MILNLQGKVGPRPLGDGAREPVRLDKSGGLVTTRLHGKYSELAFRRNTFRSSGLSVVSTAGATTTVGFFLYNPLHSRKYLVPIYWTITQGSFPTTPANFALVLSVDTIPQYLDPIVIADTVVSTTILPRAGAIVANTTGIASGVFATQAVTIARALTIYRPFHHRYTGASTTVPFEARTFIEFEGTCLIAPGCLIAVQRTAPDTSGATSFRHELVWEEVDV